MARKEKQTGKAAPWVAGIFHTHRTKTIPVLVLATSLGTSPPPVGALSTCRVCLPELAACFCLLVYPAIAGANPANGALCCLSAGESRESSESTESIEAEATHREEVLTFAQMQHNKHRQTRTNTGSWGRRWLCYLNKSLHTLWHALCGGGRWAMGVAREGEGQSGVAVEWIRSETLNLIWIIMAEKTARQLRCSLFVCILLHTLWRFKCCDDFANAAECVVVATGLSLVACQA